MSNIGDAIDRLLRAQARAGAPPPSSPASEEELDVLRAEVAPLRVPEELEAVWRRFQEGPPDIIDTFDLPSPEEVGRYRAVETGFPRALLMLGLEADEYRLIELHGPGAEGGGTIWAGGFFDWSLREVAPSLADLLAATASAWERGIVRWVASPDRSPVQWDRDAWEALKAELLPPVRTLAHGPGGWLRRWHQLQGTAPAEVEPRGATSTIGELLAHAGSWIEPATIQGRIRSIVSAEDVSVSIDDGTGQLRVYIPAASDRFQLAAIDRMLEIDVRPVPAGMQVVPPFDPDGFEALATAVRRVRP